MEALEFGQPIELTSSSKSISKLISSGKRTKPVTIFSTKNIIRQPKTGKLVKKFKDTEKPKTFKRKFDTSEETGKEPGYNVYMFEHGKKVKANEQLLPRAEAERLGRDIADNSLSASFRVEKTERKVPSATRSKLATGGFVPESKFRPGKSSARRGFWTEKPSHRLDSYGEKSGISAAKLLAQRRKGIFRL
jgi:hypothetical protein